MPNPERTRDEPRTGTELRARRRFGVTPRGRVVLLLLHLTLGAAWLSGDEHARLAAAMLAAPLIVDLVAKLLTKPDVEVALRPRRTHARSPFLELLHVQNRSPSTAVRQLRIAEPRTQVYDSGGALLPWLGPGATVAARLQARSPRRGLVPVRAFRAVTEWPLGLFEWRLTLPRAAELLSEPARVALSSDVLRALADAPADPDAGHRESDAEFHSLREYRYGDDARHVHGRRSASLGTLVTKVMRSRPDPDCALIVDVRRAPGVPSTPTGEAGFELHLSRAATLCDELTARGMRFRAVVIDHAIHSTEVSAGVPALDFLARLAVARSVSWRALSEDDLDALPDASRCFWLPAGGFRDTAALRRVEPWVVEEAAS